MKQKRFGLIVANILPILALIGEVALIINHQIGWAVGTSIVVAVIGFAASSIPIYRYTLRLCHYASSGYFNPEKDTRQNINNTYPWYTRCRGFFMKKRPQLQAYIAGGSSRARTCDLTNVNRTL